MALRPLYMGLHFYLPGATSFRSHTAAVAHARYMVSPQKEELVLQPDASIHARYMAERPGSAGLFGPNPDQAPQLSQVVETIHHHQGPVWRLIVSVTEQDARTLAELSSDSLLQRASWEVACRMVMPQIAEELGLSGLDWAAAMHRKEGHPHIHLLFWEPGARRERGQVSEGERRQMRRLWMRELYRPVRAPLQAEKHRVRESLRTAVKELQGPLGSALTLSATERRDFAERMMRLATQLPPQGRLAVAYMPSAVKNEVRHIAAWMLQTIPEFRELAARYQELAEEMARHQSDNPASHQEARIHAMQDLFDRISPTLLRTAVAWDREHGHMMRTMLTRGRPSNVDAHVLHQLQAGLRQMARQDPTQRKETAHVVVRAAMDGSDWTLSAAEQARTEAYLVRLATHARAHMIDTVADVAQGLWRGLFDELAEWEQVARFIREDRARRREREAIVR
ncbi:MobP3 family relaxase [Sulfobacillus harzensis]|uniref:Uncharacterized protein n=1 Tax=Sulfobacillus harzensis TaxID=2729629 RepID=A0A7Y0L550_9FIRM|nr:MobP3 family relaxase [Sulfobacillus harzensis]NMP23489.1 hypothetical protein [Sulfobacillus harzensis]